MNIVMQFKVIHSHSDNIPSKLSVFGPKSGLIKNQNWFIDSLNVPYFWRGNHSKLILN